MKKFIALFLGSVLLISIASGCAKKTSTVKGDSKTVISIANWVSGPVDENSYVEKELEKIFSDVDFKFMPFERATFKDQLNTRIAGGDIPDIIFRSYADEMSEFARQNIICEVPYDMVKKNAPNIFNETEKYGTEVWFACQYNGKNYGVPFMQVDQATPSTNGWRLDWLQKVGIAKVPETLEEYEAAFDKFVNNDPDGNGKKDTYALTSRGMDAMYASFSSFFLANKSLGKSFFLQPDGTVAASDISEGSKKTLKMVSDWYKRGYIDPEFVTSDTKIVQQKWNNNKVGFVESQYYQLGAPNGGLYKSLTSVNKDAKVAMGPAPHNKDGSYGYLGFGKITGSLTFGAHLKKDQNKLEKILGIVDKMVSDFEVVKLISRGQEGTHYKFDDKGYTIKLEPYETAQKQGPIGNLFFSSWSASPSVQDKLSVKDKTELMKYAIDSSVKDGVDYFSWIYVLFTPEDRKIYDNLMTLRDKTYIEIITGSKPVEFFDEFVKQWTEQGGDTINKRANEIYKAGLSEMKKLDDMIKN